ncbi:N-alpha-acetyltransferase 35, NatC auxiliary subunit-like protein [Corchorus olitorius]|uniref:N-alpha-acetyltransferase 35, NatC auxiliary subunit-like protein n=1 Tax=Corchorus olitorius TaxID=93759 RepID=A0A1R3G3N7_9ROSI|nr:N-alpha-acetyltransferase 35, NatC auxiliary subunit-like protein [Corchorus olitorius]
MGVVMDNFQFPLFFSLIFHLTTHLITGLSLRSDERSCCDSGWQRVFLSSNGFAVPVDLVMMRYYSIDEAIENGAAPILISLDLDSTVDVQCTIDVMDHPSSSL